MGVKQEVRRYPNKMQTFAYVCAVLAQARPPALASLLRKKLDLVVRVLIADLSW